MKKVQITTKCPQCQETKILFVSEQGYKQWKDGEHIQRAFPTLNADDRERLMTGTCPKCWDKMFGGEWQ